MLSADELDEAVKGLYKDLSGDHFVFSMLKRKDDSTLEAYYQLASR